MGLGSGKAMKKASYKAPPSSTSKAGMSNNTTSAPNRGTQINTATPKKPGKKTVFYKGKRMQ
jgi:hypothetical protein